MIYSKYRTANHAGGLKECLESEEPITKETFELLIKAGLYKWYAYDERINANRYILNNHDKNLGLPTWLHVYD